MINVLGKGIFKSKPERSMKFNLKNSRQRSILVTSLMGIKLNDFIGAVPEDIQAHFQSFGTINRVILVR